MNQKSLDWHLPPDHLFNLVFPLFGIIIAGGVFTVSRIVDRMKVGDASEACYAALAFAFIGVLLLFTARLPLYRQRLFWTIGPGRLDRIHRCLYAVAYLFIIAGAGLFFIIWRWL